MTDIPSLPGHKLPSLNDFKSIDDEGLHSV